MLKSLGFVLFDHSSFFLLLWLVISHLHYGCGGPFWVNLRGKLMLILRKDMFLFLNNWVIIKSSNLSICKYVSCLFLYFVYFFLCYMVKMKWILLCMVPFLVCTFLETGIFAAKVRNSFQHWCFRCLLHNSSPYLWNFFFHVPGTLDM